MLKRKLKRTILKQIPLKYRRMLTYDKWKIGLYSKDDFKTPKQILELKVPSRISKSFHADPFIYKDHIFCEYYNENSKKGEIVFINIHTNEEQKIDFKEFNRFHISYPFVLSDNQKIYMMPEISDSNAIPLFKCTRFPYEWKFEKNLLENVKAVDSTITYHKDLFWLFYTIKDDEPNSMLHIAYSDSLFGRFYPIANSPLKVASQSARMAGKIIKEGKKLIRVAQDNSWTYGGGLRFFEITKLNKNEYAEKEIGQPINLDFVGKVDGMHTYNVQDNLIVLDTKEIVISFRKLLSYILH